MMRFLVFSFLIIANNCYAETEIQVKIPEAYKEGIEFKDKFYFFLERVNKNSLLLFVEDENSKRNKDLKKRKLWSTECTKQLINGVSEAICYISKDKFTIMVSKDPKRPYVVVFDNEVLNNKKVNVSQEAKYKIDNSASTTYPYLVLDHRIVSKILTRDAMDGENLYYSIGKNNKYETHEVNLSGFKESINFAKQFIELNN